MPPAALDVTAPVDAPRRRMYDGCGSHGASCAFSRSPQRDADPLVARAVRSSEIALRSTHLRK
ncbi:hypothetical protein SsS58_04682 [Streptomyces scabiei]|uniref:Uncharacterized protein n=1 Tax=Streptomyces scabiei TaxID=1930 RepID=A0A100JRD9_STRSC|nr:hypothetical protein SsS58_04682 [Streptomyces scabiei]